MNYIYDIVLNFNKEYFDFYEWKKSDTIINIKKIPIFSINNKIFNILKYDKVVVDTSFIDIIRDKTFTYTKLKVGNASLLSNGKEVIGVLFDNKGNLIKRSSLLIDEEEEVLEELESDDNYDIKIISHKEVKHENIGRWEKEKKTFLNNYLRHENNINNLKYLYYDYFEKENDDINVVKNELLNVIKNTWDKKLDSFYNTVKMFSKIKN